MLRKKSFNGIQNQKLKKRNRYCTQMTDKQLLSHKSRKLRYFGHLMRQSLYSIKAWKSLHILYKSSFIHQKLVEYKNTKKQT